MLDRVESPRYGTIHFGRMRLLFAATAFVGISVGAAMLIAPDFSLKVVGFPERLPPQEPIVYGALASIWTAVGFLCILGMRSPLKFASLFAVQLVYKSLWFLFIFLPLMARGDFPAYGWAWVIGNTAWIAMDIMATPWSFLLAKDDWPERFPDSATPQGSEEVSEPRLAG